MANKEIVFTDERGITTREPYYPVKFRNSEELKNALVRAHKAHHMYEQDNGIYDKDWAEWYAKYLFGEQAKEN